MEVFKQNDTPLRVKYIHSAVKFVLFQLDCKLPLDSGEGEMEVCVILISFHFDVFLTAKSIKFSGSTKEK
jgi:hypothetical protein